MSEQTTDRQLPITQIDELWAIASKRWGDPGRRTPPPDPRFRELREHLGKIEALFAKDKGREDRPIGTSIPKKKIGRKITVDYDDDDGDDPLNDEIPF